MLIFKGKDVPEHTWVEKNVAELIVKLTDRLKAA